MADPNAFLHDPRRRNLAVLAAIAVVMVALAVLALWHQASLVAPKYAAREFFPGLGHDNHRIARIHIASKAHGSFDVVFKPSQGWVLPGEHDYPADFAQVRTTVVGMAGLETVAPKTDRPEWLHYLHLVAPSKGGDGTLIELKDEHGKTIAAMIAGKTKDIGEPGAKGLFVRKPDSNQSWLVRTVFEPSADPTDWINKDVVGIQRSRIQQVAVKPASGPSYTVSRAKKSDTDFTLQDMPKGRELSYATAPDGPAAALVDFTFDKVVPASQVNFKGAAELVTRTFDGLTVTTRITAQNGESWASVSASAAAGNKAAETEAAKINKAAQGWAFQIPSYKAAQFTTPLDNLLKQPAAKAPTAPKKR